MILYRANFVKLNLGGLKMEITKAILCRKVLAITLILSLTLSPSLQMIAFADGDAATKQTAKEELENIEQEEESQVDPLSIEVQEIEDSSQAEAETELEDNPQAEAEAKLEDSSQAKAEAELEDSSQVEAEAKLEDSSQAISTVASLSSNNAEEMVATNEDDFEFSDGTITGYTGTETEVIIPEAIKGFEVTTIGDFAFNTLGGCDYGELITSITIPKTVTAIDDCAFYNCSELTKIRFNGECPELGTNVFTDIGIDATFYCNSKYKTQFDIALKEFLCAGCSIEYYDDEKTPVEPETPIEPEIPPEPTEKDKLSNLYNFKLNDEKNAYTLTKYKSQDTTEVIIPETIDNIPVTEIGNQAFMNSKCTSVTIPDTVTEIGRLAFFQSKITSIVIPASVKTIGTSAFNSCGSLAEITFNGACPTLNSKIFDFIPNDAVFHCDLQYKDEFITGLKSVDIDENKIKWFGEEKTPEVPEKTPEEIAEETKAELGKLFNFEPNVNDTYTLTEFKVLENNNNEITEIVIPSEYDGKAVTKIANHAFDADGKGLSKITSITMPDSITEIGDWAFNKCDKMASIALSNSLTTIGENAFQRCDALTEITIPASVETIKPLAFTMCEGLKNIKVDENNPYYKDIEGVLFDKDGKTLINYPAGRGEVEYQIPEGTEKIESDAFKLSPNNKTASLKKISFPTSLKEIGDRAFMQTNLEEITIVPGVKVGKSVFDQCIRITKVNIAEGVTEIGEAQFYALENCKEITLPSTLKKIGYRAFDRLGATEIVLPEGLEEIGAEAFECSQLKSITIPSSVKKIGDRAFYLSKIENVNFAENGNLNSIGKFAFTHCKSLNNVVIPSTVKTLESGCFSHCYALTDITIPDSVTTLEDVVFAGSKFSEISLPDSITTIGNGTFKDCTDLVSAKLPANLKALGTCTFENCQKLQEAIFPETIKIKALPSDTFYDCRTIEYIYLPESIERTQACSLSLCKADPIVEYANKSLKRSKFDCFVLDFEKIGDSYYELIDAEKQIYKLKAAVREEENQIFNEMNKTENDVRSRNAASNATLCGCQGAKDEQFSPTCSPTFKFKPSASSGAGDIVDSGDKIVDTSTNQSDRETSRDYESSYDRETVKTNEPILTLAEEVEEIKEEVLEEQLGFALNDTSEVFIPDFDFNKTSLDAMIEDGREASSDRANAFESSDSTEAIISKAEKDEPKKALSTKGKVIATTATATVVVASAGAVALAGSTTTAAAAAATTVAQAQATAGAIGKLKLLASKLAKLIRK